MRLIPGSSDKDPAKADPPTYAALDYTNLARLAHQAGLMGDSDGR